MRQHQHEAAKPHRETPANLKRAGLSLRRCPSARSRRIRTIPRRRSSIRTPGPPSTTTAEGRPREAAHTTTGYDLATPQGGHRSARRKAAARLLCRWHDHRRRAARTRQPGTRQHGDAAYKDEIDQRPDDERTGSTRTRWQAAAHSSARAARGRSQASRRPPQAGVTAMTFQVSDFAGQVRLNGGNPQRLPKYGRRTDRDSHRDSAATPSTHDTTHHHAACGVAAGQFRPTRLSPTTFCWSSMRARAAISPTPRWRRRSPQASRSTCRHPTPSRQPSQELLYRQQPDDHQRDRTGEPDELHLPVASVPIQAQPTRSTPSSGADSGKSGALPSDGDQRCRSATRQLQHSPGGV